MHVHHGTPPQQTRFGRVAFQNYLASLDGSLAKVALKDVNVRFIFLLLVLGGGNIIQLNLGKRVDIVLVFNFSKKVGGNVFPTMKKDPKSYSSALGTSCP